MFYHLSHPGTDMVFFEERGNLLRALETSLDACASACEDGFPFSITLGCVKVIKQEDPQAPKFSKEDIEACWMYAEDYFLQVLNGEYPLEAAREDLRSLIGSKWDSRVSKSGF